MASRDKERGKTTVRREGLRRELRRKAFHLAATVGAAAVVYNLGPLEGRITVATATMIALSIEVGRSATRWGKELFERAIGELLREHERERLTGATTLAIGYLITTLIAPPYIAASAILAAGTGDAAGALIGRGLGRYEITRDGKTIEGSLACLTAALIVTLPVPGLDPIAKLGGAIILTLAEASIRKIDDNPILAPLTALAYLTLSSIR